MDFIERVFDAIMAGLESVRDQLAVRDFRAGLLTGLALVLAWWVLVRLNQWAVAGVRRSRAKIDEPRRAERLGRLDARLDAEVTAKLGSNPEALGTWNRLQGTCERAEAEAGEARAEKGRFLFALAKKDRGVAELLADRERRASAQGKRYGIRPTVAAHLEMLLQGAVAWAAYRKTLSVPPSLTGLDLGSLDLSHYDLRGVDLYRANLTGARLDGADLSGADLIAATCIGASFLGARMEFTVLARADLSHAAFGGASLRHAELSRTCLASAQLDGADLTGARFQNTVLPDGRIATGGPEVLTSGSGRGGV